MQKHPLNPQRLRRVPAQFSWVDHRLVRHRLLSGAGPCGSALYLFLVTVGDEQGLSYYSDTSICGHLGMSAPALRQARRDLLACDLIAWEAPLYQVLALEGTGARTAPDPDPDLAGKTPPPVRVAAAEEAEAVSAEEGRAGSLRLAEMLSQFLEGGAR